MEKFKKNNGKVWQDFVIDKAREWENMNMDWVKNFHGPILVVFYNDLVQNLEQELTRMMDFLKVSFTKEDLECALNRKEGIYKRKKRNGDLRKLVYNSFLTSVVNKRKNKVLQYVRESNIR